MTAPKYKLYCMCGCGLPPVEFEDLNTAVDRAVKRMEEAEVPSQIYAADGQLVFENATTKG